jgi:hypothetical protein
MAPPCRPVGDFRYQAHCRSAAIDMIVSFPIHDHLRDSVQAIHTGYSYTNIRGAQWHWATGMPSTFSVRYTPARFTSSPIKAIALLKYTEHTQRRKVERAKIRYQNPAAHRHPWRNLLRQKARNHFCNTGRPARQAHSKPSPGPLTPNRFTQSSSTAGRRRSASSGCPPDQRSHHQRQPS